MSSSEKSETDNVKLPEDLYDITARGHLDRAISLRQNLVQVNPLQFGLYSAWELRNGIERLLFEYLVLMHGASVSKKIEKLYSADTLIQRIETVEPDLSGKIEFMNLMLSAIDAPLAVVPDLDALSSLYARLNNYLHSWKRPEKTAQQRDWWAGLWRTLDEAECRLTEILDASMGHVRLDDAGLPLYEAWKSNELNDEQVIAIFRREFHGQQADTAGAE